MPYSNKYCGNKSNSLKTLQQEKINTSKKITLNDLI